MRLLSCLALVLLASCSATNTSPEAPQPRDQSSVNASPNSRAASQSGGPGPAPRYSVRVSDRVPQDMARSGRAFVRFAMSPSVTAAARVPFATPEISVTTPRTTKRISTQNLSRRSAWLLDDGAGTTSAVFVLFNDARLARRDGSRDGAFLVAARRTPICDFTLDESQAESAPRLYVTRQPRADGCASGYRIALDFDANGAVEAVRLTVREP